MKKEKLTAAEVAHHFNELSKDEKKFFHLHIERMASQKKADPSIDVEEPIAASPAASPADQPNYKTRDGKKEKSGFFSRDKKGDRSDIGIDSIKE